MGEPRRRETGGGDRRERGAVMKVRLFCTYYNEKKDKTGEQGDVLEMPKAEAERLLAGGSAELVEPPKRSERV